MALVDVRVRVQDEGLIDAYIELLRTAPEFTRETVNKEVNGVRPDLLADLQAKPGPVKYPIQWKSAKQRRAFFATNGFGRGIPTQRTDTLINAYRIGVEYTANNIAEVYVNNDTPYYDFVKGRDQQPFHEITGWRDDQDVFDYWSLELEDRVETALIKDMYAVERL